MSGLGLTFLRRGGQAHPTAGSDYIKFKDEAVFNILMEKGVSSDGVGITKEDAAKVTSINSWFTGNTMIESFDELQYFTNLVSIGVTTNSASKYGFENCTNFKKIKFPSSLKTIGYHAFQGCVSLTGIIDLRDYDIENIYSQAFDGCTGLEDIYLGESTKIVGYVYRNAPYKYSEDGIMRLPNLQRILGAAFQGCKIRRVENLGSVEAIGASSGYNYTFYKCLELEFVRTPRTLALIGSRTFQDCSALATFILEAETPPTIAASDAFSGCNCTFYVPDGSVEAYKVADKWSALANRIKPISEYQG